MAAPQASSRLELLQARFQQKQLQEKEQKLLQLYDQQQQRAYQVVQRGSASSNGSNHAASISQHTVTRTTSSSHTTSTSQGGKVRQMFDERRQTSVKGIDRSYPLEPLENKLRKQPNGNSVQKNGNLTVNRQSVTVKRVARADVNSNLNGGKPVVSYHEEITRESFGPSAHQQQDDEEEFGNENHDAQYANGNHRGETRIEEVLDEDTIERNRMMAKLHLMEYDETLKHHVRNDLESEEFPEDFLVDVPDKLPKQNVTKKLSQAEIRLERFKNANARRNNNITKNSTTVPKKRSDPIFPSKSSSSKDRVVKDGTREVSPRRSGNRNKSPGNGKLKTKSVISEHTKETISDTERSINGKSDTPWFFCRESETSAKTYTIETKPAKRFESRRSESLEIVRKEAEKLSSKSSRTAKSRTESPTYLQKEKSATTYTIDTKTPRKLSRESSKDRMKKTENSKYFCRETEKSATTYAIDSRIAHPLSPELSYGRNSRSASPKSLCEQAIKTTANCAIDSKTTKQSSEFLKDKKLRSDSPKFFCKESEKSATTYAINSKIRPILPDFLKNTKPATVKVESKHRKNVSNDNGIKRSMNIDAVDNDLKSLRTGVTSRSPSSESLKNNTTNYAKFDIKKQPKLIPTKSSNVFERLTRERSSSPQYFHREDKKSITTKTIKNPELTTSKSLICNKKNVKERSKSPRIFPLEDDIMIIQSPQSESPDFTRTTFKKSKTNPQFFTSNSEKSATIIMVKPETIMKSRTESSGSKERKRTPKLYASKSDMNATAKPEREITEVSNAENTKHFIRSSVSRFFSEQSKKALRNVDEDARDNVQSTEMDKNLHLSDSSSPLSLKYTRTPSQTRTEFHHGKPEKPGRTSVDRRSRDSSPRSEKVVDNGEETPEFFCYETEKSATSVSLKPTATKDDTSERSKSPISNGQNITGETARKLKSPTSNVKNRSSKSPDNCTVLKNTKTFDRRGSDNILRSTKLIREAMKRQDNKNRGNGVPERHTRSSRNSPGGYNDTNGISNESKQRTTWDKEEEEENVEVNRKVDKRAGTPTARELPVAESSSKSSTSTEVDAEIQEITVPDQYIKQERLRGTYSRSSDKMSRFDKQFTYSVHKPTKKRGSLFETSVFKPSNEEKQINFNKKVVKHASSSSPSPTNESVVQKRQTLGSEIWRSEVRNSHASQLKGKRINSKQTIPDESNETVYDTLKRTSSASSTNESIVYNPKRKAEENLLNEKSEIKIVRKPTSSTQQKRNKINLKGRISDESKNRRTPSPRASKQAKILRSAELVRQVIKGSNFERGRFHETTPDAVVEKEQLEFTRNDSSASTTIEIRESESSLASIRRDQASSTKNYERTDSVESALRRFDSIGTEADSESARSTLERSKESITKKRQTELDKTVEESGDSSKTISLKALDRSDVNLPRRRESKLSRTPSSKTSTVSEITESYCKGSKNKTREETQGQKKCRKSKESTVIARVTKMLKKSPVCKRKLFQDADSGEETETGSWKSRNSLNSIRTVGRLSSSNSNKNNTSKFMATVSKHYEFTADNVMPMIGINKEETDKTSTGADRFLTVKQLRSIEDIRKSIEGESLDRDVREMSRKSAIANNGAKRSSTVQTTARSEHRRINIDDRAENRKVISLPARSENDALGNADRSSVKCSMRFSRVVKSPSPETTKATETSSRRRRNVQTPLSKSPDTVARRPSIELKAQDTKSTRRSTPMKGTEPIGNRKTMMTTTTTTTTTTNTATRISTDVVDGVILENGLHLRDQTAETKYDNDSPTAKKSDAFVIDFDEQPSKENDAPLLRKPLLRKQSTEKQIPSTQSARPPSSVSSTYNGNSMQGQVSGSKGKMSSRAKTSNPNSITSKGSASSRSGACPAAAESLVACKICGRRFAQDRITLHEQICTKTAQKKRKQFDTMMFRVRGTDLEPFVKKGLAKKQAEKSKKPEVKSNWRRKHEDFINAIRSAKQVQAHLAAGGKLSDLPPPPVSDNCDYIQCPHCGRKFNQAAAERHIPKCEHMLHNKPIHSRAPKPRR
ncbi:Zinc finger C2HC domain-containing protein 1C [Anthophora quadrimaculata]